MSKQNVRITPLANGRYQVEARRGTRGRFHLVGDSYKSPASGRNAARAYVLGG
jgi:hypothetical protein